MKFYFREATFTFLKTWPYILLRIAVGLALSVGVILTGFISLWLLVAFDGILSMIAVIIILGAVILFGIVLRPYLLYLVDGGHVAVYTEIITNGRVPDEQFQFGRNQVRANFGSVTVLFVIDWVLKQVLRQINQIINTFSGYFEQLVGNLGSSKQARTARNLVNLLQYAMNITVGYVDKAIMAHIFRTNTDNKWALATDGVVLYAKTWKPIFAAALIIATIFYTPILIGGYFYEELIEALGGEPVIEAQFSSVIGSLSDVALIGVVIVLVGILVIVQYGIIKPWLTAVILTIYLNETADAVPDEELEKQFREEADEFWEMEQRAADNDSLQKTGTWRDRFLP